MNKFSVKEVFIIHGGNSGLTEKLIYQNQSKVEAENIPVFSSATEQAFHLPKVSKNVNINNKPIKTFSADKSYIIVARNGKAGLMNVITGIDFTINDHAYIFELKRAFIGKVDLYYFIKRYQNDFLEFVSSKGGNGTFSKEIAENYEVEIPDMKIQNVVSREQKRLLSLRDSLCQIQIQLQNNNNYFIESGKSHLIGELFHHFQGHQLTDKYIYDNPGDYPVYTGADNEIKGFMNSPLFEDETRLPCLIYQTKGNNEYKSKVVRKLFNANNTAVLYVKKSMKHLVNIDYIQLIISNNMKLSISSQEGVSYIDTKILNTEIFLPKLEEQDRIVNQANKVRLLQEEIEKALDEINKRINENIVIM